MKPDRRHAAAQFSGGGAHRVISLQLFLADIQQPDGRLDQPQGRARKDVTHQRELHQIVGVAFDIGTEIEHDALAAPRREEGRDRRPVDAGHRFQHEFGDRHQRAGIAGRNDTVGASLRDRLDREPHARTSRRAQGHGRLCVIRDDFFGMLEGGCLGKARQLRQ